MHGDQLRSTLLLTCGLLTDAQVLGWLSSVSPWPVPSGYVTSMRMSLSTTVLLVILEAFSIQTVYSMIKVKPRLYVTGWAATMFNNIVMGPFVGMVAFGLLCVPELDPWASVRAAIGTTIVHTLGYYTAHRAMHTKALYWAHSFHHQFNTHVVPSAANAVSFAEYFIAYMLPFILGCVVCRPDAKALYAAIALISFTNLLIHTPVRSPVSVSAPFAFSSLS